MAVLTAVTKSALALPELCSKFLLLMDSSVTLSIENSVDSLLQD